ncbi:MAG: hypothetical protein M5U29_10500 [Anaerolineae bacterium]|nr:hypothetical protein [Anaerolineae bacterium]
MPRPQRIVVTVQREVAERLVAVPGDMSLLAVSVQFYGQPRIALRLGAGAFWPRPDVDSAVVRIDVYQRPPVDVPDEALFFRVVRAGFGQKRKQLRNAISAGLGLDKAAADALLRAAGIAPQRRAETLSLEEWAALARAVARTAETTGLRSGLAAELPNSPGDVAPLRRASRWTQSRPPVADAV